MTLTVPAYGWGGNPNAALWSRHDCPPSSTRHTPSAATGGFSEWLYRVPASVKAANGDLLEFIEAHERDSDSGCDAIYMRRSTDSGVTWSTPITVYREASYEYQVTYLNSPCPSEPLADGKIVLVFCRRISGTTGHQILYVTSTDHGATWSSATNVTSTTSLSSTRWSGNITSITNSGGKALLTVAVNHTLSDNKYYKITIAGSDVAGYNGTWITSGAGDIPAVNTIKITGLDYSSNAGAQGTWTLESLWNVPTDNGIILSNGPNAGTRIVWPCDHRYADNGPGQSPTGIISYAHYIYADYSGGNLTFGVLGRLAEGTLASPNTTNQYSNENSICETSGGSLISMIRIEDGSTLAKGYSVSQDYGATWDDMAVADGGGGRPSLPGGACDCSLLTTSDGSIYLAWPEETAIRGGLAIAKLTFNEGTKAIAVAGKKRLWYFRSGYCGLVEIDSSTIGCSFERTHDDTYYSGVWYEEIGWVRIPKAWVVDSVTAPTYPQTYTWEFNEQSSGLLPTAGSPFGTQGDYDQRGVGGAATGNATATGNGWTISNTAAENPPILCRQVASRTIEDAISPGLGSITYEVEYTNNASGALHVFFDNKNNAGSNGVTASISNVTNRPVLNVHDGTTSLNLTPSSGTYVSGTYLVKWQYIRGGSCVTTVYDSNGAQLTTRSQADTLSAAVNIRGSTAAVVGRQSTAATGPFNGTIKRLRVTRGTDAVTTMVPGATKTSKPAYVGTSTTIPASAPTSTGRIFWMAARYDGGYASSTDYAGGYNPPRMPVTHGQGITSYTDPTGGLFFTPISDDGYGAQWWEVDSNLGTMLRCAPNGVAGGISRFQVSAVNTALDVPQNTGTFTLMGAIKVVQAAGSVGTIVGNTVANTDPGFRLYRTAGNKVAFFLTKGAATNWVNLSSGFTNSPNLTPGCYFICVRGNVTTIQLSYATISNRKAGTVTHLATESMTDRTGTWNSVNKLTWGVNFDQSNVFDCGLADWMLYSSVLNDAAVNSAAAWMAPGLPGGGGGIGAMESVCQIGAVV